MKREIRNVGLLIIWTDCDREGENIGAEIRDICLGVKRVPVKRAKFSEITQSAIQRAMRTLVPIDENVVNAVDARQELDLRIGAAFTRIQTLFLRQKFPAQLAEQLISYGSCQFPTLGFIVERYRAIQEFQCENFWKIEVRHRKDQQDVIFHWARNRLFSEIIANALYATVKEAREAKVTSVQNNPKSKWRPLPLETVELEKKARMLGMSAKEIMSVAEKLYTSGYISYPRTETNIFPKGLDLEPLVQNLTSDNRFGGFAEEVLSRGLNPRQGRKSDQAHPPIHPLKAGSGLGGVEAKVYEFVARRFLACVSRDATGAETAVKIKIADEFFEAKGLTIHDRGYLLVYPYEKWGDKNIPEYRPNETFRPEIDLNQGTTSPPNLLSETDLIGLMDKYGIGTDATHAEHIEKIQIRNYVSLNRDRRFFPNPLGIALVNAYEELSIPLAGHRLRSSLEKDLELVSAGRKTRECVLAVQLGAYKEAYDLTESRLDSFFRKIQEYFGPGVANNFQLPQNNAVDSVSKCPFCSKPMAVNTNNAGKHFIGCTGFPECKTSGYFPSGSYLKDRGDPCRRCGEGYYRCIIYFPPNSAPPQMTGDYQGCFKCDSDLKDLIPIRNTPSTSTSYSNSSRPTQRAQPSGFGSGGGPSRGGGGPSRGGSGSAHGRGSGTRGRGSSSRGGSTAAQRKRKSDNFDQGPSGDGGGVPVCGCGSSAGGPFTVRKEGPNTGREFYTCGKDRSCSYFQWKDEMATSVMSPNVAMPNQRAKKQNTNNTQQPNSSEGAVNCNCNMAASCLVVRKEGPNCGRPFFGCGNNRACNFFQWGDELQVCSFLI